MSTRVLEIYGGPFDKEKDASLMHQQAPLNCGWAGPEFIRRVMETDERTINDQYEKMVEQIYQIANGTSGSHIAGISAVALADAMIDTWIFKDCADDESAPGVKKPLEIPKESWDRAVAMAKSIIQEQMAAGVADVNENATQYIVDWVLSNRQYFGEKAIGTCLGTMSADQGTVYIFPSILNSTLTKAGYSPRKTMKYLADNGIITSVSKPNGGKEYCVRKWFDNRTCRFVEFDLKRFSKPVDPLDEDEAAEQRDGQTIQEQDDSGFMQLAFDQETPFDNPEPQLPY